MSTFIVNHRGVVTCDILICTINTISTTYRRGEKLHKDFYHAGQSYWCLKLHPGPIVTFESEGITYLAKTTSRTAHLDKQTNIDEDVANYFQ